MNVIAYFNLIEGNTFSSESFDLISIWKDSWRQHGWNPVLLDENMAKKNPLFTQIDPGNLDSVFYENVNKNFWKYHKSCYARLLAYCQYVRDNGPTLYADYDVINYGFVPDTLKKTGEDSCFCISRCAVYLGEKGKDETESVILNLSKNTHKAMEEVPKNNDMYIMNKYTNCFNFPKDQNGQKYVSSIMPHLSNNTPLIHYDGGCYKRGFDRKFSRLEIVKQYQNVIKNRN